MNWRTANENWTLSLFAPMLIICIVAVVLISLEIFALAGVKRPLRWLLLNRAPIAYFLGAGIWWWLAAESYHYWGGRGVFAELLVLLFLGIYVGGRILRGLHRFWHQLQHFSRGDVKTDKGEDRNSGRTVSWDIFFVSAILFLASFPFSVFAHAIGLFPGLVAILAFAYFFAGATRGERSIHNILAIVLLVLFVWLWGEAGRQGLVVMPVDLPEGRDDMSFTADGVANALETELKDFGSHETEYGPTEAARIFSKEFPRNLWFKGTEARPPLLEGLQASHVIVGTDVEGFPLFSVYHILRHLRGTPLLEGQILLGEDGSLTLALRRSNAPLECGDKSLEEKILKTSLSSWGDLAVEDLWKALVSERTSWPKIPDARGCKENWFRWVLDRLDVMSPPAASEERLTNITIHGLTGDEALTAAIHLAAIEAMSHISPERLAIYYDNTGRPASSLAYYKRSLPDLLAEAHNAPPILSDYPRQRLASALIRIGDFEKCQAAEQAYSLAAHLFPDDLHVQARIGYAYLVRFKERDPQWRPSSDDCDGSGDIGQAIGYLQKAMLAADPDLREQNTASSKSRLYPRSGNASFSRLGLSRWRETLAWASSNLAYALVLGKKATRQEECRPELGNTLARPGCLAALATRANPKDVRAAITQEYVRSKLVVDEQKPACESLLKELERIDPKEPLSQSADAYDRGNATLHNTLLMEDQLIEIYRLCNGNFEDRGLYHRVLFKSLLILDYVQGRTERPADFSNLQGLEEYRRDAALLDSTYPKEHFSEQASLQLLFLDGIAQRDGKSDVPLLTGKDRKTFCDNHADAPSPSSNPVNAETRWGRVQSLCARLNSFSCQNGEADATQALKAANGIPDDYFIRENLGIARLKAGMYKEALDSFQSAVRLRPDDPELRYMLAFALDENDRPQEARDQFRYGQLLDPKGWKPQVYSSFLARCPSVAGYIPPEDVEVLQLKLKSHSQNRKRESKLELARP